MKPLSPLSWTASSKPRLSLFWSQSSKRTSNTSRMGFARDEDAMALWSTSALPYDRAPRPMTAGVSGGLINRSSTTTARAAWRLVHNALRLLVADQKDREELQALGFSSLFGGRAARGLR
jgi:hypothetical protein